MFNPRAASPEVSTRLLVFRQAAVAALKAHRLPTTPATLPALVSACADTYGAGATSAGIVGRTAAREALADIRSRLFHAPGRDVEAQTWWHEALATAVFGARVAQLHQASIPTVFLAALLHRAGEALALKTLARIELDYRLKLDSSSRREWCSTNGPEMSERLVRCWDLAPEVGACVLSWTRFGECPEVSGESTALYFGRLFAVELLHPDLCVPGAIDHAAADLGLTPEAVTQTRAESARARELIRGME
jgi:hypothetical protein